MTGKPQQESGFALLLVFAMASIIAITMYMALPRVAFESERDKEQLLIDRGEQYTRAIQLYVRKTKRFPAKIEDLENTNGIRFLRKQYLDPMTGKSEWRLIHAGPGGTLIDSLNQKQTTKKEGPVADNFITELNPAAGTQPDATINPALRRRPSDQSGAPGNSNVGPIPPDPTNPSAAAGTNVMPAPGPTAASPNLPGRIPPVAAAGQPTAASGGISVLPTFGGPTPNAPTPQPGQVLQQGQILRPGQVSQPGQVPTAIQQQITNPNGQFPGGSQTNASQLIQGLLTTPRPGGLAGVSGAAAQQAQSQIVGGGIAGVASNYKGMGIKLYHDQEEFPKWEFVYDMTKDTSLNPGTTLPQAGPAPGVPIGGATATPGAALTGTPATGAGIGTNTGTTPPPASPQPPPQ